MPRLGQDLTAASPVLRRHVGPALLSLAVLAAAPLASPAGAACLGPPGQRLGLALSGGSARGLAHVGALRAIEERGLRVGCIAGTSMGAVVGSLYASGYPVARIEQLVRTIEWHEVFTARPERELVPLAQRVDLAPAALRVGFDYWKLRLPRALQSDYRVNRLLAELLAGPGLAAGGDFDRLPVPFRAVAADLRTGERVVLGSGSLQRAVRASLSYPTRFIPVPHGETLLVDGGIVDNLPVDVARAMGADFVIAVDTRLPPLPPGTYENVRGLLFKLVQVLMEDRNRDFAQAADLTVTPDLEGVQEQHYARHQEIVERGHDAATRDLVRLPEGIALPGAGGDGQPPGPPRQPAAADGRRIGRVEIEGNHVTHDRLVGDAFGVRGEERLDLERILRGLDALHATRLFESAWVEMKPAAGEAVDLTVHVSEAPHRVLEAGAAYDEADKFSGFARVRNRNLFGGGESLGLTALGSDGEVGLRATLAGDRLPGTGLLGYYARGELLDEKPRVFLGHEFTGRAEFERVRLAAGVQRHLGSAALLRAGLSGGRARIQPRPAFPSPLLRDEQWAVEAAALWDTLDDPWLPTSGARLSVVADRSVTGLGATHRYWRLVGRGRAALTLPVGVLQAEALAGISGGEVPAYDLFRVGGPDLMPGFHRDQLWGRQAVAGAISHSLDLGPLRLTARVGAGGVFDERAEIESRALVGGWGLSIEHPTRFGPIAASWGHSPEAGSRFYLSAGRVVRP